MDYVQSYKTRFELIDRDNEPEIAMKKKKDIRKTVHEYCKKEERDAFEIVWKEMAAKP